MLDLIAVRDCIACQGGLDDAGLCDACGDELQATLHPLATRHTLFANAWAIGTYAGTIGALVRRAKFDHDQRASALLVGLLRHALRDGLPAAVNAVVPIPTTPWRIALRGFHLPEQLGEVVVETTGAPMRWALRRRWGGAQARRSFQERLDAGDSLFSPVGTVAGHVLLVDDVVTSGASAHAAAAELIAAGATSVSCLVLAAAGPLRRVRVGFS
ncbi:MAG: ComF family protein [Myxococcales bacterium]|nr:ComF family protein [Myxococcales bacterium]